MEYMEYNYFESFSITERFDDIVNALKGFYFRLMLVEERDWAKEAGLKMGDEATVRELNGLYVLIQGSKWWQLKQRFNLVRANKKR